MEPQSNQILRKKCNFIFCFVVLTMLCSHPSIAQHFEVGPQVGFGYTNISESTGFFKPADIGKNVWKPNFGANVVYYFRDPYVEKNTFIVGALYRGVSRGSISPIDEDSKF